MHVLVNMPVAVKGYKVNHLENLMSRHLNLNF